MWLALTVGLSSTAALLFWVYKTVRKPFLRFIEKIKVLSDGNFTSIQHDDSKYRGEIEDLNISVKKLAIVFRNTISEIRSSSKTVNGFGLNTNKMAKNLSSANYDQASAIEEVSASLEEMNANIESSLVNSEKSKQHTQDTNDKLLASNSSAQELLKAMSTISEKIRVIEDIATQTNLLALNASIEAKQAGVAGKGFNVVAGEVRLLAENCKKAADDISLLTEKGMQLSEQVSENLQLTLPSMSQTVTLMDEISTSSKELKAGSDQIIGAINGINVNTQANAKLAEAMSNNSGQLSKESKSLIKNVAFFQV